MDTDLSHQSRRALPRDWVASKVAVHEDCDLVNMFLSSISQRCFGLSQQIPRYTFQRNRVEFTRLARSFSGPSVSLFQQVPICLGPSMKSLMQADLYRVASSFFRIKLRLTSHTSLSCGFFRSVLTAIVFELHPDSLMMSGACLKSGSTSKCSPV